MHSLSRLDLFGIGRTYMEGRALHLAPGIVSLEGSDANLFVGSTSFMASAVEQQSIDRAGALLLDSAVGEDLDRYAWDKHQMTRLGASPARGDVRFFRPGVGAGAGTIAVGTTIKALTGAQYVTTSTCTFSAVALSVSNVDVRAVKAGKDFQVGRNQLRILSSQTPTIFDPTLQVTNDDPTAGGEPREEDADFKLRIKSARRAQARGTLDAIAFGARGVPGVVSAQAIEVLTPTGTPARVVQLYIADSSGIASRALGTITQEKLTAWRAAGIAVALSTSAPQLVSVVLHLSFLASTQGTSALAEQIRASVVGFINSLPVNTPLLLGDLQALLRRYTQVGLVADQSTIVAPQGDLLPAAGITLRTTIDLVTVQ